MGYGDDDEDDDPFHGGGGPSGSRKVGDMGLEELMSATKGTISEQFDKEIKRVDKRVDDVVGSYVGW